MQTQNSKDQQPHENRQQPQNGPAQGANSADERDEKIKAEPDTARIRSERQSVIDGGQAENKNQ